MDIQVCYRKKSAFGTRICAEIVLPITVYRITVYRIIESWLEEISKIM